MSRRGLGIVLLLIGGVIALACIALALRELGGLYAGVLVDPLAEPASSEADTSRRMLVLAAIGAAGAVPMMVGIALLKRSGRKR